MPGDRSCKIERQAIVQNAIVLGLYRRIQAEEKSQVYEQREVRGIILPT